MELTVAKPNPEQDIGLALLGVGTTFGIWSALNTSPVGMVAFGTENEPVARAGMNLALALVEGTAAGIYLVFKKEGKFAAIATGLTGFALWAFYDMLLKKGTAPPILTPFAVAAPPSPKVPVSSEPPASVSLVTGR